MTAVLLAEDDASISEPLARALRREGYEVAISGEGPATLDRVLSGGVDLLVLDLGLPGMDGLEVCRRLRSEGRRLPVLVLTARVDEVDTVVGLDAGADDYVTKPFRLAELMARVRALLRRGESQAAQINGVRLDAESRRVWVGDEELSLTTKEFDLLHTLVSNAGKVVTRDQLMREVWGETWWGSTKTLDMHVSWLRRKLDQAGHANHADQADQADHADHADQADHADHADRDASSAKFITTVRGVGFRFEQA